MLNLLLFVAPGSTVMAGSLETGQADHNQSQNADAVSCHEDLISTSGTEESACDQHPDNTCESDCTTCVLAHIGVPVYSRLFIQESTSYMDGVSVKLIHLRYSPNPPPPKHFS